MGAPVAAAGLPAVSAVQDWPEAVVLADALEAQESAAQEAHLLSVCLAVAVVEAILRQAARPLTRKAEQVVPAVEVAAVDKAPAAALAATAVFSSTTEG